MKLILKIISILTVSIGILSCSNNSNSCYEIGYINLAIESPRIESVFYKITDRNIINRISGDSIFKDNFESKVKKIKIIDKGVAIDSSSFSRIIKANDGVYLINRTIRFISIGDSIRVAEKIKGETLELILNDNSSIRLNYCR